MGERVEEAIVGRKKNQSLKIVCVELEMCGGISWDDNSKCDRHNFSFLFFSFLFGHYKQDKAVCGSATHIWTLDNQYQHFVLCFFFSGKQNKRKSGNQNKIKKTVGLQESHEIGLLSLNSTLI